MYFCAFVWDKHRYMSISFGRLIVVVLLQIKLSLAKVIFFSLICKDDQPYAILLLWWSLKFTQTSISDRHLGAKATTVTIYLVRMPETVWAFSVFGNALRLVLAIQKSLFTAKVSQKIALSARWYFWSQLINCILWLYTLHLVTPLIWGDHQAVDTTLTSTICRNSVKHEPGSSREHIPTLSAVRWWPWMHCM